jgi:FkbM family methyltransferase
VSGVARSLRRSAGPLRRWIRPSAAERRVASLGLRPGELAIDCGANVGDVTAAFARSGAEVHAFEPNPHAFAVLDRCFGTTPNVRLHHEAALDRADRVRLYLHVDTPQDPVRASTGSSLLPFKGNVDAATFLEVDAIDLARFVLDLERPVRVLKLDVEGVECPVVHHMLDTGAIDRVETMFVELHDAHIPELRAENARLRERLAEEGLTDRVLTDWE